MRVHATLHGFAQKERDLELPENARADDAPRALGIRPELVLVFRDERPLPGDAPLREGDRVRILRVVSGGDGTAAAQPDADAPSSWLPLVKGTLLGLSLTWLAFLGFFVAGLNLLSLGILLVLFALLAALGLAGYRGRGARWGAAAGMLVLLVLLEADALPLWWGAWATPAAVGVLLSILLPPPRQAPGAWGGGVKR